jgi:hypothetical protein
MTMPEVYLPRTNNRKHTTTQGLWAWDYGPGFVHMGCFYLPKLDAKKRYCFVAIDFVAIDRATRLAFLAVYENKDKKAATDFLKLIF